MACLTYLFIICIIQFNFILESTPKDKVTSKRFEIGMLVGSLLIYVRWLCTMSSYLYSSLLSGQNKLKVGPS